METHKWYVRQPFGCGDPVPYVYVSNEIKIKEHTHDMPRRGFNNNVWLQQRWKYLFLCVSNTQENAYTLEIIYTLPLLYI